MASRAIKHYMTGCSTVVCFQNNLTMADNGQRGTCGPVTCLKSKYILHILLTKFFFYLSPITSLYSWNRLDKLGDILENLYSTSGRGSLRKAK